MTPWLRVDGTLPLPLPLALVDTFLVGFGVIALSLFFASCDQYAFRCCFLVCSRPQRDLKEV